jgi:hypothetical protein
MIGARLQLVLIMALIILIGGLGAEENLNESIIRNITSDNFTENITIPISENITLNDTAQNYTLADTFNFTLNETQNITINITETLSLINNSLENLTIETQYDINGSNCHYSSDNINYNYTVNGTIEIRNVNLTVALCYNKTEVYCYSNPKLSTTTLFRIDILDYACKNGYCEGAKVVSNPYDISDNTFDNATSFICFSKMKQDGYTIWMWRAVNLYKDSDIFYFDFSNSSFISYDNLIVNTTINNITNNYNFTENITNNIINNITANLTGLETRISMLEAWSIKVDEIIKYLVDVVARISSFLEKKIFVFDFSGSKFVENKTILANETINNQTNNFFYTINITNNITNNITAENLIDIEERVSLLESWRLKVIDTLNYLNSLIDKLIKKVFG